MEGVKERFFKVVEKEGRNAYSISFINKAGMLTVIKSDNYDHAQDVMKDIRSKGMQPALSISFGSCVPVNLRIKQANPQQ